MNILGHFTPDPTPTKGGKGNWSFGDEGIEYQTEQHGYRSGTAKTMNSKLWGDFFGF
jgi:hypothetical protein